MAKDAHVKEVESLFCLAADIRNGGLTLSGHCSQMLSLVYMKETELLQCVQRIQSALESAAHRLDRARYEYENYMYYSDSEHFSESEAYSLQCAVEDAHSRYAEVQEDLSEAQLLYRDTLTVLYQLKTLTDSFSTSVQSQASSAAHVIQQAAHEIIQYKEIR